MSDIYSSLDLDTYPTEGEWMAGLHLDDLEREDHPYHFIFVNNSSILIPCWNYIHEHDDLSYTQGTRLFNAVKTLGQHLDMYGEHIDIGKKIFPVMVEWPSPIFQKTFNKDRPKRAKEIIENTNMAIPPSYFTRLKKMNLITRTRAEKRYDRVGDVFQVRYYRFSDFLYRMCRREIDILAEGEKYYVEQNDSSPDQNFRNIGF